MKKELVKLLREESEQVSGETLAAALGISRSAVWKHLKDLRKMGYEISSGRKGYRLLSSPNVPYGFEVQSRLKTKTFGREIYWFPKVSSTQIVARDFALKGEDEGTVFVAEVQSEGKGRQGRKWHSSAGGLWFSFILRPPLQIRELPFLSLLAGLSVAEVLFSLSLKPQIKWPNDVLLNGKKVAGILVESESELDRVHFVIVGIGINCFNRLPDLPGVTSVKNELGVEVNRAQFLADTLGRFEKNYFSYLSGKRAELKQRIEECLAYRNKRISFKVGEKSFEGVLIGVDLNGELVLKTPEGLKHFTSGEIAI